MNNPPPDYLAQIHSTMTGGPPPGSPIMLGGQPPPPPPPVANMTPGPIMSPMPPPPPPPMNLASTPPAPPAPAPPPPRHSPFLEQVHGAMNVRVPAKETELRGPQLLSSQQERNTAFEGAVQAVTERSQHTAAADYALALDQERKAGIREDAANYTAAERQQELVDRQADFDQSARALSKMSLQPGRYYANMNTGQTIAALVQVFAAGLGGFVSSRNGGRNPGLESIYKTMDDDLKAQEFAYTAALGGVNAKQTAFSMAMQKYNNMDAARASARAAMLDTAAAQVAKETALWKGTDAANRGQMAIATLHDDRMQQIASGVMFTPERSVGVGAQYRDPRTGMTYNEKEAHAVVEKADEREFKREEKGLDVAGQLMVEGAKVDKKDAKDTRALTVELPNGDLVTARDAKQADDLDKAAVSIHSTSRLVAEAKKIRSGESFRIPGSADRARLTQIQKNLITEFAVQHDLGAISGPDMGLAEGGTAALFDVGPGPEAALDGLLASSQANLRNRVKTVPGAPGSAKGEMPASFTAHGKK